MIADMERRLENIEKVGCPTGLVHSAQIEAFRGDMKEVKGQNWAVIILCIATLFGVMYNVGAGCAKTPPIEHIQRYSTP